MLWEWMITNGFLYSYLTRVPCASPLRSVPKNPPVWIASTHERPAIYQRLLRTIRRIPVGAGHQSAQTAQYIRGSPDASFCHKSGLSYDRLRKKETCNLLDKDWGKNTCDSKPVGAEFFFYEGSLLIWTTFLLLLVFHLVKSKHNQKQ